MIVRSIGNVLYQPKVVNLQVCHFGKSGRYKIKKNLHAIEKDNSKAARRELDQFIRDTIADAKMATNSGVSNRQRLSEIKSNKSLFVKMRNYQILP